MTNIAYINQLPRKFKVEVEEFLKTELNTAGFGRATWVRCDDIGVFLRVQMRWSYVFGRRLCIDFANVYVHPDKQGCGLMSELLKLVEDNADGRMVFVENVLDPDQFGIYERRGYTMAPLKPGECEEDRTRSFYKDMA